MNNLSEKIKKSTGKSLMTHVVMGFPSLEKSLEIVKMMDDLGVPVIELQLPFSDPIADGKTMMTCNTEALKNNISIDDIFSEIKKLNTKTDLVIMTYYNIVFTRGVKKFCKEIADMSIKGVIIPDMPIDEEDDEKFISECKKNNIAWIPVVSPITTEDRIKKISNFVDGFWYVVSRRGITGVQGNFQNQSSDQIGFIKKYSKKPISLAFGVSSKKDVEYINSIADMAVIGSYIQNIFLNNNNFDEALKKAKSEIYDFIN